MSNSVHVHNKWLGRAPVILVSFEDLYTDGGFVESERSIMYDRTHAFIKKKIKISKAMCQGDTSHSRLCIDRNITIPLDLITPISPDRYPNKSNIAFNIISLSEKLMSVSFMIVHPLGEC